MKNLATAFLVVTLLVSVQPLAAADRAAVVPPGLRFVPIAPCRLLDTAVTPATSKIEESLRHVDLDASRCSSVLPPYALHYSLQVTTYSQKAPEALPVGTVPARQAVALAASLNRKFDFDIPAGSHIAVDVDGYYVAPGTPLFPFDPRSTGVGGASTTAAASEPSSQPPSSSQAFLQPRVQSVIDGTPTSGDIYLNAASPFTSTGVRLDATHTAAAPHVAVRLGDAAGASSFSIFNSSSTPSDATTILKALSNGHVVLPAGSYLDGKTSYMQGPAVPGNMIHDVTIVNPRDSAGTAANRVVFFNARSEDEVGSPATTKFQAFTRGYYQQNNINFDSQILYHWPGGAQYYYRALSTYDPGGAGKETFWVKAATNSDSVTNTRADMYVSGWVGIGTTTPATQLDVRDAVYGGARLTAAGQQVSVLRGGYNAGYYSEVASYIPAGAPGVDSIGWKIRPYYYGSGGRFDAVTVTPTGKVGIGIEPTALLQLAPPAGTAGFSQSANGTFLIDASGLAGGRLAILEDGRVGIGTNTPTPGTRLDVAGAAHFAGNVDVGGVIYAKYQDVAEWVPSEGDLPAGTVVVLNRQKTNAVTPSSKAYDTAVAGVVSGAPGVLLGVAGANKAKIATTGRVKVRVDARKHPVSIGDLLVTSDVPGTAMLSEPLDINGRKFHQPGTLIGKALEPLARGEGEILVLLSLQ
jgi:hypothetical protein